MKRFYLLLASFVLVCGMAMAQPQGEPGGQRRAFDPSKMAERRTEQMTKELSLNDMQKAAVLSLNKELFSNMQAQGAKVRAEGSDKPDRAEMKEIHKQMEAMQADFNGRLQKILTPEQYQKYQKNEEARRERRDNRPPMPQN